MEIRIRLLLIILLTIIGLIVIIIITNPKIETINLINNYKIVKKSDTNIKLFNDKKEVITDYIGEYSYGKRFILLKCIEDSEDLNVIFYIIDTKDDDIHGPYKDYETFNLVIKEIVDEEVNDYIKTN